MNIPIEQFGRDHWSTLLYVEVFCVDKGGKLNDRQMRTRAYGGKNYPTRLKGGALVEDEHHDDWACLEDMCAAGLLKDPEVGEYYGKRTSHVGVALTDYGWYVAGLLRRHRAEGKLDEEFVAPPLSTAREVEATV